MKKSKRLLCFLLAFLIATSTIIDNSTSVLAGYFGNGTGGGTTSTHGGDSSKWKRTRLGGGYIVSFVKYSLKDSDNKSNTTKAISQSSFDNAYKDSILVYNSRNNNTIARCKVCIDVAISNGTGDILGLHGSSSPNAHTIAAVKASSAEGKELLGFRSHFGEATKLSNGKYSYNFNYEDKLNEYYGKGGKRDLRKPSNRKKVFNAVKKIYNKHNNPTLGGITEEKWLDNDAGKDCVYALLIVPVCIVVDSIGNDAKIAACYPSSGVVNKTSLLDDTISGTWGSYSDSGNALNNIFGENAKKHKVFRGYVPYGFNDGVTSVRVAANVAAYVDKSFYAGDGGDHEGVDDIVYSINAADSGCFDSSDVPKQNDGCEEDLGQASAALNTLLGHLQNIKKVSYLYQDSWVRDVDNSESNLLKLRIIKKSNVKDESGEYVSGIKDSESRKAYKFVEGARINLEADKFALYNRSKRDTDAMNIIFTQFSNDVCFKYIKTSVEGDIAIGTYDKMLVARKSLGLPDDWYEDEPEDDESIYDAINDDDQGVEEEELFTSDADPEDDNADDYGSSSICELDDWYGDEDDDFEDDDFDDDFEENGDLDKDWVGNSRPLANTTEDIKTSIIPKELQKSNVNSLRNKTIIGQPLSSSDNSGNSEDNMVYDGVANALSDTFNSFDHYLFTGLDWHTRSLSTTNKSKISSLYTNLAIMGSSDVKKIYRTNGRKKDYTKELQDNNHNVGVGVQVYTKADVIKSYLKTYDIKVDADGNLLDSKEGSTYVSDPYTTMSQGHIIYDTLEDDKSKELKSVYYLICSNFDKYGYERNFSPLTDVISHGDPSKYDSWFSTIVTPIVALNYDNDSLDATSEVIPEEIPPEIYANYKNIATGFERNAESSIVSVGTNYGAFYDFELIDGIPRPDNFIDGRGVGYTVYAVRVFEEVDVVDEQQVDSSRKLEDYELSHVYNSIYKDGVPIRTTSDYSYKYWYTASHTIGFLYPTTCDYYVYTEDYRRYVWLDTEKLEGERSISSKYNEINPWKTYVRLPQYDKNIINSYNEDTLVRENNEIIDEYIMLTRDMGNGDSVLPSSISKQKNSTVDLFIDKVLKMTPANKPSSTVKGTVYRKSNYKLTFAKDLFTFRGGWVESPNPPSRTKAYKLDWYTCWGCPHATRIDTDKNTLRYKNSVTNEVGITITENIYKYLTNTLTNGKNIEKVIQNKSIEAPDSGSITGVLRKKYAFPMVKNNKIYSGNSETTNPVLTKFYSEVEMIAEIPTTGDTYIGEPSRYKVWMMNEKLRKVENSSLYFVSAESHNDDAIDRANTKLYSDNSVSNRNGTNGTPILYSGADVDLAVKMNIDIDTFGYSLDLINKNEVPEGIANYKKIVYDESNLVTDWGNTSNKTNLLQSFQTFSTDIFNSIDADIILEDNLDGGTSNIKKYGNFSTSLGKYAERPSKAKEDGVYQIVIKHGKLVDSNPSYQEMLKQLAKDYYGDVSMTSEADSLFKASKIYKTIVDAIEYDGASVNKSQKHDVTDSSIKLGNDNHWYDEQVKTFVIRRYTDSARFRDVTLSDKLDYNMGNTSNGRNDATQNSYNNSNCKWYLYLYYNKKHASDYMKNIITDWYDPSKDATRQTAINSSTILVNHLYIPSVDFRIASDTVAN